MSTLKDLLQQNQEYQSLSSDERQLARDTLAQFLQDNYIDLQKEVVDQTISFTQHYSK